jgi:prophage regulatory protein
MPLSMIAPQLSAAAKRHLPLSNAVSCFRSPVSAVASPLAYYAGQSALVREIQTANSVSGSFTNHQRMEECLVADAERIIRIKTVLARTGLSRSTLYRKIAEGTFPRQVAISINGAGWHESTVNRWIANPAGYRAETAERPS